ncbi:MAG: PAS domain-containing sensor histidine kinase [Ignavibacteria bacterium]|nr:PAS domain-containing sensor histidine kinase [Ignavibacteria bacterium]
MVENQILASINFDDFKDFIFHNSTDIFWILDENFQTTFISNSIENFTGYSVGEYVNLSLEQKFSESSVIKLLELFDSFKYVDDFKNIILEYRTKSGFIKHANVSGIVVKDDYGRVKSVYGISVDLEEKILLEKNLIIEKQKNEEAQKFKSIILDLIGHEFRTPLIGILGFIKILINNAKNEDEKEILNYIYHSSQRLNSSLNSVITLAAIESGQMEINFKSIDLMELIYNIYNSFEPIVKEKNITFDINLKNYSSKIVFDENCLYLILSNLIDNAIKFTEKGRVFLDCGIIKKENGEKMLNITIQDTGIGMDSSKFDVIFEPFRQISEGHKRIYEGLGLGLTVTRKLVEKFNGSIQVESKLNEGSIFTVFLPLA